MIERPPDEEQALYAEIRRLFDALPKTTATNRFSEALCRDLEAIRQLSVQLLALQRSRRGGAPRRRSTDEKE